MTSRTWLLCLPLTLVFARAAVAAPEAPPAAAAKPPAAAAPAAPAAAAAAAAPAEKVPGPPEVAWKDMTPEQKAKFMKAVVTPKMRTVFQAYDPEEFKKVGCDTCHGKNPKDRKFKMPSADLPELPGTPEAFQAKLKAKPSWVKWTKFMSEKVVPEMATLLGIPAFDHKKPDNKDAFGCNRCHTLAKAK